MKAHDRVLLWGETVGTATVGLLYLAGYLRRQGVKAYCQWNDLNDSRDLLRSNVQRLIETVKPSLVGVSIKWFPHMARGLEICRIVKEYAPEIATVLGGNTASYYWREFIREPSVDYVIRGDGELPLLKLCRGDRQVPNLVDKKSASVEFSYIEDQLTPDVFLSHLPEIFVDPDDPHRAESFFIYTGKRCNKKCFYCGGSATAMRETYGSARPFFRPAEAVRSDLTEAGRYTNRLLFDFDFEPEEKSQRAYFEEIFGGRQLSDYLAYFYFWKLPRRDTVEFLVQTFGKLTISIDLASLSERHRLRLQAEPRLGVKPQPTDQEILSIFEQAERCPGLTLDVNLISGMPLLEREDFDASMRMVKRLTTEYSSLGEIQWGRLHAQPGAPILQNCDTFGMRSMAKTFQEFMRFSRLNLESERYPTWREVHYPFIVPKDGRLFQETSRHYMEVNQLLTDRASATRSHSSFI